MEKTIKNTPTPHNGAEQKDIAKTVLFPGDPDRAEWLAKTFLEGAKLVSSVRGEKVFTGRYNKKRVTIMSSGMGAGSAGLYSYELFNLYGVDKIIRTGTTAALQKEIKPGAIILAVTASTDTNYEYQYNLNGHLSPAADFGLLRSAASFAEENKFDFTAGPVFSSDCFSKYNAMGDKIWKSWAKMGCMAQDMETYAVYCNAAYGRKKALSILTAGLNKISGREIVLNEKALTPMALTALSLV